MCFWFPFVHCIRGYVFVFSFSLWCLMEGVCTFCQNVFFVFLVLRVDFVVFLVTRSALPSSLGAFANLRKATINFVMSVCLSLCPPVLMEQLELHCKVKVKFTLEQATQVQRRSRGIDLLFL